MKQKKNRKARKILYVSLIVILLAVFIGSAVRVGTYYYDAKKQGDRYNELADMVENARRASVEKDTSEETEQTGTEETEETGPQMLEEYAGLYEMNPDTIGWIYIEGTNVNYPVMMKPEDPDFYLKRNFDGEKNAHGCIYIKAGDPYLPSDNLTLYGHNMGDGSMFSDVFMFQHEYYMEAHPYIRFDTLYEHHTYQVFSVFVTTATVGEGFKYHNVVDVDDAEEFDEFISTCKRLSIFDLDITPTYGDKIICLSTCEYSNINGRLVVAAVRID